jgi:hypothetical protein
MTFKLKRGLVRLYITRYDLRFKVKPTSVEEESQVTIHRILTEFFNIILQADETTTLPPYLDLDRNVPSINDLSFTYLRNYFSRLYSKTEGGNIYCSLILASSLPTRELLNTLKYKLAGLDIGLWPRPTNHEQVSDIGWLLYSSLYQDEGQIAEVLSNELGIIIRARWHQIRTADNNRHNQGPADPENKVRALHLEGPSSRIQDIKDKLPSWYGSSSNSLLTELR